MKCLIRHETATKHATFTAADLLPPNSNLELALENA